MTRLAILKKLFIILTSFHFLQTLKVIIHFLKKGIFKHRNVRLFFSSISKHSSILKSEWRTVCYFLSPAPGLNHPSKDLLHYFDLARITYYFSIYCQKAQRMSQREPHDIERQCKILKKYPCKNTGWEPFDRSGTLQERTQGSSINGSLWKTRSTTYHSASEGVWWVDQRKVKEALERLHLRVVCPVFDTPVLEINKLLSPEEGP